MNTSLNSTAAPSAQVGPISPAIIFIISYGIAAGIVAVTLDVWVLVALRTCKLSGSTKAIFAYENVVGAIASLVRIFYVPAVTLLPTGSSPYALDRVVGFIVLYNVWGYACSKSLMGINRLVFIVYPTKSDVLGDKRAIIAVLILVVIVDGAFAAWTIAPGYLFSYNVVLGCWGFTGANKLPQIIICPIFVYTMMIVSFACCIAVVHTLLVRKQNRVVPTTRQKTEKATSSSSRHEMGVFMQFLVECIIWFAWSIQFYLIHYVPAIKVLPATVAMEFFRTSISLASPILQIAFVKVIREGVLKSVACLRRGEDANKAKTSLRTAHTTAL